MEDLKIDKTIDARGSACPGPMMEAIKAVKSASIGSVIEVLSSDKGSTNDIPAWVKKVGHELIKVEEKDGYWSIVIKKVK